MQTDFNLLIWSHSWVGLIWWFFCKRVANSHCLEDYRIKNSCGRASDCFNEIISETRTRYVSSILSSQVLVDSFFSRRKKLKFDIFFPGVVCITKAFRLGREMRTRWKKLFFLRFLSSLYYKIRNRVELIGLSTL